jgi:hypothetical protein
MFLDRQLLCCCRELYILSPIVVSLSRQLLCCGGWYGYARWNPRGALYCVQITVRKTTLVLALLQTRSLVHWYTLRRTLLKNTTIQRDKRFLSGHSGLYVLYVTRPRNNWERSTCVYFTGRKLWIPLITQVTDYTNRVSNKFHSNAFQIVGLETFHYRRNVYCINTFHVDGNNKGAHTTIILKKTCFGNSNF